MRIEQVHSYRDRASLAIHGCANEGKCAFDLLTWKRWNFRLYGLADFDGARALLRHVSHQPYMGQIGDDKDRLDRLHDLTDRRLPFENDTFNARNDVSD